MLCLLIKWSIQKVLAFYNRQYHKQKIVEFMHKRNSQKKLNGEILMMQNELMSKLATLGESKKQTDELGFNLHEPREQSDALLSLLSKSKNITKTHAKEIEIAKKCKTHQTTKRKVETEGTFLTGLGLTKENQAQKSKKELPVYENYLQREEESDPDSMLKDLINRNGMDDLQELRRMIKQTGSNLQGCSRKLNKSKKSIMQIADRYASQVPTLTLNFLNNYREFEVKNLDEMRYQ